MKLARRWRVARRPTGCRIPVVFSVRVLTFPADSHPTPNKRLTFSPTNSPVLTAPHSTFAPFTPLALSLEGSFRGAIPWNPLDLNLFIFLPISLDKDVTLWYNTFANCFTLLAPSIEGSLEGNSSATMSRRLFTLSCEGSLEEPLLNKTNATPLSSVFSNTSALFFTLSEVEGLAPNVCEGCARDLSPLLSVICALFGAMEPSQPLSHQSLPHSFPCNGGWGVWSLTTNHSPLPTFFCLERAQRKKPGVEPGSLSNEQTIFRLEAVADAAGDAQVVLRRTTRPGFGELGEEIVHRPEPQREMAAERNVYPRAGGHGERVVRCSKDIGMRHAEQVLNERRKAAVVMEIDLRASHVREQVGVHTRSADVPDVISAEFANEPVRTARVIGERSGASIRVETREAGGRGIRSKVGILDRNILRASFLRDRRQAGEKKEPHEKR